MCITILTYFSAGKPIRFAKYPARISPKFPVGTTNRILWPSLYVVDFLSEKYEWK
jgi:hypothetical protein